MYVHEDFGLYLSFLVMCLSGLVLRSSWPHKISLNVSFLLDFLSLCKVDIYIFLISD